MNDKQKQQRRLFATLIAVMILPFGMTNTAQAEQIPHTVRDRAFTVSEDYVSYNDSNHAKSMNPIQI